MAITNKNQLFKKAFRQEPYKRPIEMPDGTTEEVWFNPWGSKQSHEWKIGAAGIEECTNDLDQEERANRVNALSESDPSVLDQMWEECKRFSGYDSEIEDAKKK